MDILETIWVTSTVVIIMTNERALVWKASSLFFLYLSSVYLSCQKEYFTGSRSVQRGWGQQCLHICVRSADYTGSPQGWIFQGGSRMSGAELALVFRDITLAKDERLKSWWRRFANNLLIDRSGSRISIRWKSAFFKVEPSLVSEWWFFRLKGCIRT